jgi:hypothetical protein
MSKLPRDDSRHDLPPPDQLDDGFFAPAIPDHSVDEAARKDRDARLARDREALEHPRGQGKGPIHDLKYADEHDEHPSHFDEHGVPLPRTFGDKMFGVGFWGWVRLGALCLVAGAIFAAGAVNPFAPGFLWSAVPGQLAQGVLNVFTWSVGTAWRPLLFGAIAVGPIWLLWRLITVPFRH